MEQDQRSTEASIAPTSSFANSFVVERTMTASNEQIYDAWVRHFDTWFASSGKIDMVPTVGRSYWFSTFHEGKDVSHYGRFLELESDRVVEQTWVTGKGGTNGAETVVRIELTPLAPGTRLVLTHGGFYSAEDALQHSGAWPAILAGLDQKLSASN
jgi:uncharacterized protein YndB with AHSA1/START domain